MGPRTIEGTWEEVERLAGELAGRRVRVTVLDEVETPGVDKGGRAETAETTAFDLLSRAGLIGCLKASPDAPTDLATNPIHMEGFGGE